MLPPGESGRVCRREGQMDSIMLFAGHGQRNVLDHVTDALMLLTH